MRIARFTNGGDPRFAVLQEGENGEELAVIAGDPLFTPLAFTGERVPLIGTDEFAVRLLTPVIPRSKVIGVGRNYAEHAAELGNEVPAEPLVFLTPNTAVIGPDDPIVLPEGSTEVHYEGELAVVIGRVAKEVPPNRVGEVVIGYTCANDVTARDLQARDGQWWRAKGFDTSCPLGPVLHTGLSVEEAGELELTTRLDGELVQSGRTSQMVRGIADLVSYVSRWMTLLPGDVVLTGTPAGVGPMKAGQRVEVTIEGIGTLGNPVVQR